MKTLSNLLSIVVGLMLATALLVLGGAMVARHFIMKLTALPPKPVFANDAPIKASKPAPPPAKTASANAKPAAKPPASPKPKASPVATPVSATKPATKPASPKPSPSSTPTGNGYQARVVQPIGLVLRGSPSRDSSQIGGIDFNQKVVVLEESTDGEWIKIRLNGSNQEGWVRAGNTEKVN